ncbi:hypothetical protein NDU88_008694, partial [Pleurodeles waltl]
LSVTRYRLKCASSSAQGLSSDPRCRRFSGGGTCRDTGISRSPWSPSEAESALPATTTTTRQGVAAEALSAPELREKGLCRISEGCRISPTL